MARVVSEAIAAGRHLIVEAGTGIGKSLAYLVPAVKSGKKTIVSTRTKALQEQLLNNDLPLLAKASRLRFKATCLKGRANYVCLKRLREFETQPLFVFPEEIKYFRLLQRWARKTATGDRSELRNLPDKLAVWNEVCSQRELCTGQKCQFAKDCFLARAREAAERADVVIINHHLFFANLALQLATGTSMLPKPEVLIFDEAHEIESVASNFLGVSIGPGHINELLRQIDRQLGLAQVEVSGISATIRKVQKQSKNFFANFAVTRDAVFKLTPEMMDGAIDEAKDALCNGLLRLTDTLADIAASGFEVFGPISQRCKELAHQIKAACSLQEDRFVHWAEVQNGHIVLKATPISLAETLAETVFATTPTVILTSATLSSERSFDYIKRRLGIPDPIELMVDSTFDYRKQAVLYIPTSLPLPEDRNFVQKAADEIVRIIQKSKGRAFVLCTSIANMKALYQSVSPRIQQRCLLQGQMPNSALLEQFRSDVSSVLFATASFWQGVDVQGEALSCVIVDKLPFAVPTDPLIEARIDRIRKEGGNPFYDFQVPQAIIALKQGFGRLIRTRADRGVLSILDKRILQRGYGQKFLDSLPPCPVTHKIEHLDRIFS